MSRIAVRPRVIAALALSTWALASFANMGTEEAASDDPNFAEGRKAIEAQDWPRAVKAMQKVLSVDSKNADALNWLGFAQRKQGFFEASFEAYREALRINPNHKQAHEYIGEAYLMTDQVAKAEEHLAALNRLCTPIPCEEHKQLKRAIDHYKQHAKK